MQFNLWLLICFSTASLYATELTSNFKVGLDKVMQHYVANTGLWVDKDCVLSGGCAGDRGLWYWANAIHLLVDYQNLTGDRLYYAKELHNTYAKNKTLVIGRNYFDDDGWWALSFIALYQLTHKKAYLTSAEKLAEDMYQRGAQNVCYGSGGIYWDAKKTQVGSIANELYLAVNAKLYLLTLQPKYKMRANDSWNWFKHSGLLNSDYTIDDNYTVVNGKCGIKVGWKFTYTHGVILSGLVDLAKINHDPSLGVMAQNIAKRAMYNFSLGGILTETCTNVDSCADDAFLFKGIFVYNLAYLASNALDKVFINQVQQYLTDNYTQLLANQSSLNDYGFNWSLAVDKNKNSPVYNPADIVTQLSALYLIDANLFLHQQ